MQPVKTKLMLPPLSPSDDQRRWLASGAAQPGGKLPLHDEKGRRISKDIIDACLQAGWAEPWICTPDQASTKVCRLTDEGRAIIQREKEGVIRVDFSMWRRDNGETEARLHPDKALRH